MLQLRRLALSEVGRLENFLNLSNKPKHTTEIIRTNLQNGVQSMRVNFQGITEILKTYLLKKLLILRMKL